MCVLCGKPVTLHGPGKKSNEWLHETIQDYLYCPTTGSLQNNKGVYDLSYFNVYHGIEVEEPSLDMRQIKVWRGV